MDLCSQPSQKFIEQKPDLRVAEQANDDQVRLSHHSQEIVIATIRATDVSLGLRRVPAGFYISVQHGGQEWRTQIKPVLVDDDNIEWSDPIPIPSVSSVTLCIAIYATFEFQPVLGDGEQLRQLTATVGQLLDHSANSRPYLFSPEDGQKVSPCSSLLLTLTRRRHESCEAYRSMSDNTSQLEGETNRGHAALSHYIRFGEKQDLQRCVEHFECVLDVCPLDHPCRAVAQSNMATAQFILYRADGVQHSLDLALKLFYDALAARPVGHPDRPFTLIQLAGVHQERLKNNPDEADATQAEALLREASDLSSAKSHERRFVARALQIHAGHKKDAVRADDRSPSDSADADPWTLGSQLLLRFRESGDLPALQHAISLLDTCVASSSAEDGRYRGGVADLGWGLLYRFQQLGQLRDLEEAISRLKDAVDLTPDGNPDKLACINNLSVCFLSRFKRLGKMSDLEEAISRQRDAVNLTPERHFQRPGVLNSLADSFLARFEHIREPSDLEEAIPRYREAVDLTPGDSPDKPGFLNNLARSLLARYRHLGDPNDLDEAISRHKKVDSLTHEDHPEKPKHLNNLANSLLARFEHLGELNDLEEAISRYKRAGDLTSEGHPHKAVFMNNLGCSYSARFKHLGELRDLEEAISSHQDSVDLSPQGDVEKPGRLYNLANTYQRRFDCLGELNDLEEVISKNRDAVSLTPERLPEKPRYLNNLATALYTRFERVGEMDNLEEAISSLKDAVDLTAQHHPNKPMRLNTLAHFYFSRFEGIGELKDLEESISKYADAVNLISEGHPEKWRCLKDLGNSLLARFERLGELNDLEDAISRYRDTVSLISKDHPDRSIYLSTIASSYMIRFKRLAELGDLEEAISSRRDAVDLTPQGDPYKSGRLSNLGNALKSRFEHLGELKDLEEAISVHREAVNLIPQDHPERPGRLSNLGNACVARFEHLGDLCDLEEAISRCKESVMLTPEGHASKPGRLDSLANAFQSRFERFEELNDLEEAISKHREAMNLAGEGHPDRARFLNNVANSLRTRFQRLGELKDLEEAILRHNDAVHLTADDHPEKPIYLNNLASCFIIRFHRLEKLKDLEEAISYLKHTSGLIVPSHPNQPLYLNNLAICLLNRFGHLQDLSDLEQAVSMLKDASHLTPEHHPDKPARLYNLAHSFLSRFKCLGELSDIEAVVSSLRDAVRLLPEDHPHKPSYQISLANSYVARFRDLGDPDDLGHAVSLYSHAACASIGRVSDRFYASQRWVSCARALHHHSLQPHHHTLLHAYSVAVSLLPQLAWIGLPLSRRYQELMQGTNVIREAAAVALEAGYPETAVEWLEQGRSVVWGELFQLRSSYDELFAVYPEHARRLRELSASLEQAGVAREHLSLESEQDQTTGIIDRHRALAIQRDTLLQEIRTFPGFERFLLHKEYSQLRASARSGPVVILNATDNRCDALIVLAEVENVIHIPLPNFTPARTQAFLNGLVPRERSIPCGERDGELVILREAADSWCSILSPLWKCVVKPVLDALAFSIVRLDLPRIFWCPTGPFTFLPVHAAGFYDPQFSEPGHKVFDFVVSSYVPTLDLLASLHRSNPENSGNLHLLAVRQPLSDGLSRLPGVDEELNQIKAVLASSTIKNTILTESRFGSVEEVLTLIKEADWVHFACHGVQDGEDPLQSGLCLADGRRLRLSDMMRLSRPRGGLAFLSACQTATGDRGLSDEAIHVASGMLFAGYGGVVGTMWSISDRIAPGVAREVYARLFGCGGRGDCREAARALQDAVGRLRENGEASFADWIPFIHVGL